MANSNVGQAPLQALSGQSALNATGPNLDNGVARSYHTLTVLSGVGVSAGVVALQLSQDGTNWFAPATNTVTTSAASTVFSVTVGPLPFQYARAVITTAITGGTVSAWVASA